MSTATLERIQAIERLPGGAHVLDWIATARKSQSWPNGDWFVWLLLGGRGSGKTRAAVEALIQRVLQGYTRRSALVARTAADARDVLVEGESGIMAKAPADFRPLYEPSKRRLLWPNGALSTLYSADEPDLLRGPQHDFALVDELATWAHVDAWMNLLLGLRLGADPRLIVATTPRPTPLIRSLAKDARTVISAMTTYDNLANLSPTFAAQVLEQYEGARLGRQELHGEILEDVEGALWSAAQLDECRVAKPPQRRWMEANQWHYADDLLRVVVGVDPASTSGEDADSTGIVVCARGSDGRGYVLADRTCRLSPDGWGRRVIAACQDFAADCVVVESNQGGEMAEMVIATAARAMGETVRVRRVHAAQAKRLRAEPVAALYEQGKVSHMFTADLRALEDEMVSFTPDSGFSPDRLDAMVHAMTELMLGGQRRLRFVA